MHSLDHEYLRKFRYPSALVTSIRQLGEFKGKGELFTRQTPQILEQLLRHAKIESVEASNRIEGVTAPVERVVAIVNRNEAPHGRSEAEIAGYRDVLNTIHASHPAVAVTMRVATPREAPFTPALVRQFHRDLFSFSASPGGSWKGAPNDIIERRPDGTERVRFQPVSPMETPAFMESLHQRLGTEWNSGEVDPLLLVPAYVLDFLCIHPFADGNGRMARLLTLLLFYRGGYEVGRYISLERIVEESKDNYYESLHASSQSWHEGRHDLVPWVEYCVGVLTRAYQEFQTRVGELSSARGAKRSMVRHAVSGLGERFRITDVEALAPMVSREMVRHVLQEMRAEGELIREGAGKASIWRRLPRSE